MADMNTGLSVVDSKRELSRVDEFGMDAASAAAVARVQAEIMVAKRFPRNEDAAFQQLVVKSCARFSFAEKAEYRYKRGTKKDPETGKWVDNYISGPSVHLAREAARIWGNIKYGTEIIADSGIVRHIRSFSIDLETNLHKTQETSFKKLILRKPQRADGTIDFKAKPEWVEPDERDLRELTNRQAAIAERNCIIQALPPDLIEDAKMACRATIDRGIKEDPEGMRKRILAGFGALNIPVEELEKFIGHPLATCSPDELADLRGIWASIAEGNTTWYDHLSDRIEQLSSEAITPQQAIDFFTAYKDSGWSPAQIKEALKKDLDIDDARMAKPEHFARMMEIAKSKPGNIPHAEAKSQVQPDPQKQANPEPAKEKPKAEEKKSVRAPAEGLFEKSPYIQKINEAFDFLGTSQKDRDIMLQDFAQHLDKLLKHLEQKMDSEE